MDTKPKKTVYKILSLGSFTQELPDGITILNRPSIMVDDVRRKWGNEYVLFQKQFFTEKMEGKYFFGKFGFDKKKQPKIYMYDSIENQKPPIPDYFIMTINHRIAFNKRYDLVRANPMSHSKVFSSAYHQEDESMKCQSMLLIQNGDVITIDEKRYVFSASKESLIPA